MTLFVVILFGLGSVLIISGIENVPLLQTTADIWNNKPLTAGQTNQTSQSVVGQSQRGGSPMLPTWADVRQSYVRTWAQSQGR